MPPSLTLQQQSRQRLRWRWWGLSTGLGLGLSGLALPAMAAEQISLSFPPLKPLSISVDTLQAFATNGTASSDLALLVTLTPPDQISLLRQALQVRFQISPTTVKLFAATQTGRTMFQRMGEVLKTSDGKNGALALQTAFLQAAADPQGLTIISVIRQFPDTTIMVNGQLGFQAVRQAIATVRDKDLIVAAIQKQAIAAPPVTLPTQPNLLQPGPMKWSKQTISYKNPNRKINLQTIPADIYLPQGLTSPAPVIVISHGLGSNLTSFSYLAQQLASYGFVVAVPEHPGTSTQRVDEYLAGQFNYTPAGGANEIINRPLDIKYLLDTLVQKAKTNPAWGKQLNLQQVGVWGQSMGGYTVLAAAGASLNYKNMQLQCPKLSTDVLSFNVSLPLQCTSIYDKATTANFRDPRVKAVIAVNPLTSLFFGQSGMSQITVPTMLVSSSEDVFAPPMEEQITPFTWLTTPEKYLLLLQKGTHFSFLGDVPNQSGPIPIPAELVGPNPALARPAMAALSVAFFKRYLAGQVDFQPYLSQTYTQKVIQPPFGLDLLPALTQAQIDQALATPATPTNATPRTQKQSKSKGG
jgi:predicted dienelactone hydrolase